MAKTGRGTTARRNRNTVRNSREMYVQGNAVKRLQEVPQRTDLPEIQERRRLAQKRKQKSAVPVTPAKQVVSRQAQRNREKAMAMNKGFVLFLTAVSIAVLFTCINYLQVKSEITASMKNVANLESELAQLKEDNDAYYSHFCSGYQRDQEKSYRRAWNEISFGGSDTDLYHGRKQLCETVSGCGHTQVTEVQFLSR